jgi:uncharacterized membrane protein YkvA (DUF1232 family)
MNFEDIINKFAGDKKTGSEDKETFFEKMKKNINFEQLKLLWHIVTHRECALEVFSWKDFALIAAAVAYVVIPLDAVPDYIAVAGLLDDAAVVSFILAKYHTMLQDYKKNCVDDEYLNFKNFEKNI